MRSPTFTCGLVTLAAAMTGASAELMTPLDYDYMKYVTEFGKNYATVQEFLARKENFRAIDKLIKSVNQSNDSYRAGHNKFSDWNDEEKDALLGLKGMSMDLPEGVPTFEGEPEPNSNGVDWRDEPGVVTPVKDQGSCGSCWAFSAIEAVESAYALAGNPQVVMSEQELVDCTLYSYGNYGCQGGWYYQAYDYLKTHKTMREADYPYYSGYSGREYNCAYNESKGVTNVSGYTHVSGNASSIKAALAKGPVNVALSAGNYVFMYYQGGIISEYSGCPTSADHAVVAVGYGEENGQEYYIVRNSWGSGWGEQGYVRISTGGGYYGVCGINTAVYQPYV